MPSSFTNYVAETTISSADLNKARTSINNLEARVLDVAPVESPDDSRVLFSVAADYEPGSMVVTLQGLAMSRDLHWEEGPEADEITFLTDPPLTGDVIRVSYLTLTS